MPDTQTLEVIGGYARTLAWVFTVFVMLAASAHVVLNKRDSRAAVAWVGLILLSPLIGAAIYTLFGINRIRRRAYRIRKGKASVSVPSARRRRPDIAEFVGRSGRRRMMPMVEFMNSITRRPLEYGNLIEPLVNGEEAYPAMIEAIRSARDSLALTTYLFDNDEIGRMFADELGAAVARGVDVRVIIDAVGMRYTFPSISRHLRRLGVKVGVFNHTFLPWHMTYVNLRSHRKIMVVDGSLGFTGGMNFRRGNMPDAGSSRILDLHFSVRGPVVTHLMATFAEDWHFCTGESIEDARYFPDLRPAGSILARGITDGPDEDFEKMRWTILGALSSAERRVRIVTPYFVPDTSIITALNVASMRGVRIDIVLPEVNNLHLVKWASHAILWQVLERGCRVYVSPPPFDHAKLMVVDGFWSLIGSANWDARSLRLNFEFGVECYDRAFARKLDALALGRIRAARRVTLEEMDSRRLPVKFRDGIARLASPYL